MRNEITQRVSLSKVEISVFSQFAHLALQLSNCCSSRLFLFLASLTESCRSTRVAFPLFVSKLGCLLYIDFNRYDHRALVGGQLHLVCWLSCSVRSDTRDS